MSPAINSYLPYIYLAARRYEHARREGERAVDLEPHAPLAHWQLGRALLFSKQEGRAVTVLERAAQLSGRASMWVAQLCYAQARSGDRPAAAMHLSELTARATTEYISPHDLAIACVGLGENDAALDYLDDAYAQRVMRLLGLGDPEFDVIPPRATVSATARQPRPAARAVIIITDEQPSPEDDDERRRNGRQTALGAATQDARPPRCIPCSPKDGWPAPNCSFKLSAVIRPWLVS